MWTILFDIDGTLIRARGAGLAAVAIAMKQMFGIEDLPSVEVSGRTDFGILSDIFARCSLDLSEHLPEFNLLYCELLRQTLPASSGYVLPGVRELLVELDRTAVVSLGLLTGNSRTAAQIKLEHFQLSTFFAFGGYGDQHRDRNDVARLAALDARRHLGERFDPNKVWVIGDTVHDITCARSINSRVVSVETGGVSRDELLAAQPTLHLADLTERENFMEVVLGHSLP